MARWATQTNKENVGAAAEVLFDGGPGQVGGFGRRWRGKIPKGAARPVLAKGDRPSASPKLRRLDELSPGAWIDGEHGRVKLQVRTLYRSPQASYQQQDLVGLGGVRPRPAGIIDTAHFGPAGLVALVEFSRGPANLSAAPSSVSVELAHQA